MESNRIISDEKKLIVSFLVEKANYNHDDWEKGQKVADMKDGMGSLLLIPPGRANMERQFKSQISEIIFKDIDNIDVIVSLNIDQDDYLYELDIWKVDYGKIISFDNLFSLIKDSTFTARLHEEKHSSS